MRQCAIKLQNKQLLAKLRAGDLVAQDAQYHVVYLVSLYNRARETKECADCNADTVNHGIAFAELVSCIEDACMDDLVVSVVGQLLVMANLMRDATAAFAPGLVVV